MKRIGHNTYQGQILAVLLIVMGILSIIVVSTAITLRIDTSERVQNEQYDSATLVGEDALNSIITGEFDYDAECNYDQINERYDCPEIASPDFNQSLDKFDMRIYEISDPTRDILLTIPKDKHISINFRDDSNSLIRDKLSFSWLSNSVDKMLISIDYQDNSNRYITKRLLIEKNVNAAASYSVAGDCNDIPLITNQNDFMVTLDSTQNSLCGINLNNETLLAVRIRAISSSSEITIGSDTGDIGLQFKTVVVETYPQNADSAAPRSIIEISYPVNAAPFEILDYVYRSEQPLFNN